jgi:hypothetical protein
MKHIKYNTDTKGIGCIQGMGVKMVEWTSEEGLKKEHYFSEDTLLCRVF